MFSRPIYMVRTQLCSSSRRCGWLTDPQIIGGLHLAGTDLVPRIEPTVDFLANGLRPAPTYVLPMHCSGFAVKTALEHALGEGCVPASVGHRFEVTGDREAERLIFPPTIQ